MLKNVTTAFKAFSTLKQTAVVVVFLVSLFGVFQSWVVVHDYLAKQRVLEEISSKEKVIKNEDEKRVENASIVVDSVPDCLKLSSVYGTDQCAQRQDAPEENIPTTATTQQANPHRVGQGDFTVDSIPLSLGGLLQDKAEDGGVYCYPETDLETGEVIEVCE